MRAITMALMVGLTLAGCEEDASRPYLEYAGGGFVFNYRNADAYYGFVARRVRALPEGAVIEAEFELPGEANTHVVREHVAQGQLQWKFQSPTLSGVVKGHAYKTTLRVLDAKGTEFARYARDFRTDVDQANLPSKPLVVGPFYTPNPDLPLPGTVK